ncbi:MAG: sodium-dependent bicarbonate transport family permease [Betaproteobacteria bacterium]|nr:sodium-dependent bicarbonate transport family permease [Betaproteobacteria bacterium]
MPIDPVVLFFLLGLIARLSRSDLRLPEALYETLSVYLLLAIGLKGGAELARQSLGSVLPVAFAGVALSATLPLLAYPVLRRVGRLAQVDAASIAAHYGSVSVVTFAVAQSLLAREGVAVEAQMPVLVALMEAPGIIVGILLARRGDLAGVGWGRLAHETLFGKAVYLLLGGLLIGWLVGPEGMAPMKPLFGDLFRGVLCLFLLEMGLVAGSRLPELRRAGPFLVVFGVVAPMVFAAIGLACGRALGLSVGGCAILATLCASASYIAAPTAMRIAVPKANPALSIGTALGVTFPFNLTLGIPAYLWAARQIA